MCCGRWGWAILTIDRSPYFLLKYRSHSWDLKDGKLIEDPFDFNTGITRSNGGLNAPIDDMLKYLGFLLGDPAREAEYGAVLKRSSLEEMWKPLLPVTPDDDFQSRAGAHDSVASSFFVHTDGKLTLIGHAGWQNGFRSHFLYRSCYSQCLHCGLQHGCSGCRAKYA
jgi:CubicO group peptidase (beta-lactamase class C family)